MKNNEGWLLLFVMTLQYEWRTSLAYAERKRVLLVKVGGAVVRVLTIFFFHSTC